MSMSLPTLHSKAPSKFFSSNVYRSIPFPSPPSIAKANSLNKLRNPQLFYGPFKKYFVEFQEKPRGFAGKAQSGSDFSSDTDKEVEARGESSMPERFRHLYKQAPDKPVRWPWLIGLAFMVYAWRAVVWELFNWKRALGAMGRLIGYISKLALALVYPFIGDPLTSSIRAVETTLYTLRAFYSSIVSNAPIPELATIVMLTSAVLSVAEASVPDSIESQPYVLALSGLIGFAAVRAYITEPLFWTLLVGLFGFGRLVKGRDYVSSALPVAAVLAAVGEPWVRGVAMVLFFGVAVVQRWSGPPADSRGDGSGAGVRKGVPLPLLCVGLAIGARVVAKWAGYRHLTWMVV